MVRIDYVISGGGLSDRLRDNDFFKESAVLPLQELAKQPYHFRWNDTGHAVLTEEDDAVLIQWLREYIWNKQL